MPDRQQFLSKYAHLADQLAVCLDGLEFLEVVAPQLRDTLERGEGGSRPTEALSSNELGDFRIVREIGRGGMGVVYEAEQISLGRTVALKVLPFAAVLDEKAIKRFKNEARAAATLDHPHIVPIHAVGNQRGVYYYAMSLINGLTLAEIIGQLRDRVTARASSGSSALSIEDILANSAKSVTKQPASGPDYYDPTLACTSSVDLDSQPANADQETKVAIATHRRDFTSQYFRSVAELGKQAAEALDHAHEHGIVHRDIKPGNLMVDASGKLWITDFGLARMESDPGMTITGDLLGTLRYMSPEQALAKRVVVDHRADIYSLGVTLYELLTLRPVFDGSDRESLLKQLAFEEAKPLRHVNRAVPKDLETIVLKAIAKNPDDRYATAQELADDLQRLLQHQPIQAKPPTVAQRTSKWAQRHKPLVASAAVILILATVGLAIGNVLIAQQRNAAQAAQRNENHQRLEAERQKEIAERQRAEAERQKKVAEENFQRAREAVDTYLTKVSEDRLLHAPSLQPLRKDLLELALKYYQEFIKQRGNDLSVQAELAHAYYRVADLTNQIGSSEQALQAHRAALQIREELVSMDSDEFDVQDDLASSYRAVGGVLSQVGKRDEARSHYRKSIEIYERIAAASPDVADYQSGLSRAYHSLAWLSEFTGKREDAVALYEKAIEVAETLVEQRPDVPEYQFRLAGSYNNLAIIASTSKERLSLNEEALKIRKNLVQQRPAILKYQHDLAMSFNNLAWDVETETEKLASFQEAIRIMEGLVRQESDIRDFQYSLAMYYGNLAIELRKKGRMDETMDLYEKAVAILERLTEENPNVLDYRYSLARYFNNLAGVHSSMGQKDEALDLYQKAVAVQEKLADQNSEVLEYHRVFAMYCSNLGILNRTMGREDEALDLYQKAVAIAEKLVSQNPEVLEYQVCLARRYNILAGFRRSHGRTQEALDLCQKALVIRERLVDQNPESLEYQKDLASSYNSLAVFRKSEGRTQEALDLCQKTISILDKLTQQAPDNVGFHSSLVLYCKKAASLQRGRGNTDEAMNLQRKALKISQELAEQHPDILSYRANLAESYRILANNRRASGQLDEAVEARQKAISIHEQLSRQAPKVYKQRLAADYKELGKTYATLERYDSAQTSHQMAIKIFEELAAQQPEQLSRINLAKSYISFGHALYVSGHHTKAQEFYQKGNSICEELVTRFPDRWPVLRAAVLKSFLNLGRIQSHAGNQEAALASWKKATVIVAPQEFRTFGELDTLGRAFFYLGRWSEAREALENSIEKRGDKAPKLKGHWWYLAMTLHQLGETEKARSYYEELVKQLEEKPAAREAARRLQAEAAQVLGIVDESKVEPKVNAEPPNERERETKDNGEKPASSAQSTAPAMLRDKTEPGPAADDHQRP